MTAFDRECPVCRAKWNAREWLAHKGNHKCPNCDTEIPSMNLEHEGYIQVNWYELIVLATYASRWTRVFDPESKTDVQGLRAFENILKKLSKYRPKDAPPLVPAQDTVTIIKGPPPPQQQQKVEWDWPETMEVKQDEQGRIQSPFYKPKNQ